MSERSAGLRSDVPRSLVCLNPGLGCNIPLGLVATQIIVIWIVLECELISDGTDPYGVLGEKVWKSLL